MPTPARHKDDPDCGHEVAQEFQTHYCTYIRVSRLLTLQQAQTDNPAETLAILALQAYELWFAVLISDLKAALPRLAAGDTTYEPDKLLRRCARLIQLLQRQTDVAEAILVSDAGVQVALQPALRRGWSAQYAELTRLTRRLAGRSRKAGGLATAGQAGREYLALFAAWRPRFNWLLRHISRPANGPSYGEYLALDELLALQEGVTADWTPKGAAPHALAPAEHVSPDELMFIVVHQTSELWFKAVLQEVDAALGCLLSDPPDARVAARYLRRAAKIQRLLADQIHIPATMLPLDFFRFRSQTRMLDGVLCHRGLSPSSGTESYQFREIEIAAGLKGDEAHSEFLHGSPRLAVRFLTPAQGQRLQQPSLAEAFERLLVGRGVRDVAEIFTPADTPNPHADLAELADVLLEFDEFFRFWRINHATMVQTMIGERSGTGFLGPEYLRETAGLGRQGAGRVFSSSQQRPRFFESLWDARTRLGGR